METKVSLDEFLISISSHLEDFQNEVEKARSLSETPEAFFLPFPEYLTLFGAFILSKEDEHDTPAEN